MLLGKSQRPFSDRHDYASQKQYMVNSNVILPLFEVNLEFIDIGCYVSAVCICCQSSLLHAKHCSRKSSNALALQDAASLNAFPS